MRPLLLTAATDAVNKLAVFMPYYAGSLATATARDCVTQQLITDNIDTFDRYVLMASHNDNSP
ncbi:MAG TPA: hypothetical protein DDZ32_01155 [Gammaproteobacteria bacterium]|nr:hypothetical protein [Gammaproteobacteria bacterium]